MAEQESEQKVTPWEAHAAEGEAKIDYDKLIRKPLVLYRLSQLLEASQMASVQDCVVLFQVSLAVSKLMMGSCQRLKQHQENHRIISYEEAFSSRTGQASQI